MFKKFISSIGFGNVTIDTRLEKKYYLPGEVINGDVEINGGIHEKRIDGIVVTLLIKYEADKEDSDFSYHEKVVAEQEITSDLSIPVKQTLSIPFSLGIPIDHPITTERIETVLRTKLLVPQAIDPVDEDTVIIKE